MRSPVSPKPVVGARTKVMARSAPNQTRLVSLPNGSILVRRLEPWFTLTDSVPVQSHVFWPGSSGLQALDQYASLFSLWRLRSAVIHYYPSVGTTQPGIYHIGVDFEPTTLPTTSNGVALLTPQLTGPVWSSGSMNIAPLDRVNRARYMYTAATGLVSPTMAAGFTLCTSATGTDHSGEIWVDYEIELSGPQQSATLLEALTGGSVTFMNTDATGTAVTVTPGSDVVLNYQGLSTGLLPPLIGAIVNGPGGTYSVTLAFAYPDWGGKLVNIVVDLVHWTTSSVGTAVGHPTVGYFPSPGTVSTNTHFGNANYLWYLAGVPTDGGNLGLGLDITGIDPASLNNSFFILSVSFSTVGAYNYVQPIL